MHQDTRPLRDNTPVVLSPEASGDHVWNGNVFEADLSHTDQGYMMIRYTGESDLIHVQIIGPDQVTYYYFIAPSKDYTVLPFTAGDGSYTVRILEHLTGTKYAVQDSDTIEISLENEFLPFLYPNQYVDFDEDTLAVKKAAELAASSHEDLDVVQAVFDYVVVNTTYDYDKADNVEALSQSHYVPTVDETFQTQTGICFDYAALMVAMLRSQSIPARLDIGYAMDIYHAWISVYTEETGWLSGLIQFDGHAWTLLDPTLASTNKQSKSSYEYMSDTNHYEIQNVH